MIQQIECIISGRVQGVLYRDFSRRKARELGLVGTVGNLSDGTVKVVAQGEELTLKKYIEFLKHGSLFSRVEECKVTWSNPEQTFSDFQIKYRNIIDRF